MYSSGDTRNNGAQEAEQSEILDYIDTESSRKHIQGRHVTSVIHSSHRYALFSSVTQLCPTLCSQASLFISNSQSLIQLTSIESVMPSNHLILCCPFLLPPSIFPSIRVFSNESVLRIRWPKYWSFQLQHQLFQ